MWQCQTYPGPVVGSNGNTFCPGFRVASFVFCNAKRISTRVTTNGGARTTSFHPFSPGNWLAGIAVLGTPGSVKSSVVPRAPFCVSNWKSRAPSTQVGSLGSVGVPSGLLGLAGSQNCTGVSTLILIGG